MTCGQSAARVPPQATLAPGQNIVAVRMPAFSASTQIGEAAFHQKGSSLAIVEISPGRAGASIRLSTEPCRSGPSPVNHVPWCGKVFDGTDGALGSVHTGAA